MLLEYLPISIKQAATLFRFRSRKTGGRVPSPPKLGRQVGFSRPPKVQGLESVLLYSIDPRSSILPEDNLKQLLMSCLDKQPAKTIGHKGFYGETSQGILRAAKFIYRLCMPIPQITLNLCLYGSCKRQIARLYFTTLLMNQHHIYI